MPDNVTTRGKGGGVLVVDDEALVRDLFARLLTVEGYAVETFDGAAPALRRLEAGGVEAVVTDCLMPGLRGELLAQHIRARWPAVRVVVVSGWVPPAATAACVAAGVAVLQKPITDPTALARAIARPCPAGAVA